MVEEKPLGIPEISFSTVSAFRSLSPGVMVVKRFRK